jgi:WD40 repeat protein
LEELPVFACSIRVPLPKMATIDDFEPGHHDRVTVLHVSFDGTRILTASADHRVKAWERNPETGQRTLTDTWTAHDADIRDVLADPFRRSEVSARKKC